MRRLLVALVVIAALTLIMSAVGCASTAAPAPTTAPASAPTKAAAAPTTAAPATKVQGVTDTEILFGSYHSLSGSNAAVAIQRSKAYKAFWAYVSDKGGINGRKIRTIVEDDGADAQKAIALVKKMVEQDKVFAINYGQNSPEGLATRPYIVQQGIAHLMIGCPLSECQAPAPGWWSAYLTYEKEAISLTNYAVNELKKTKIGVFYANNDYGMDNLKGVKNAVAKSNGAAQVVAEVAFNVADVDMSAGAIKLKNSGADIVYLAGYAPNLGALMQEMSKLGYKPTLMGTQAFGVPQLAKLVGNDLEGYYTSYLPTPNLANESDPDVKAYKEGMAKFGDGADVADQGNFTIWLQQTAVAEMVRQAGKDLTVAAIDKAALTFKDWGALKLTYKPDQHGGLESYPLGRWNKDKTVLLKDYVKP